MASDKNDNIRSVGVPIELYRQMQEICQRDGIKFVRFMGKILPDAIQRYEDRMERLMKIEAEDGL